MRLLDDAPTLRPRPARRLLRVAAVMALVAAGAARGDDPSPTAFDGRWWVALSCADLQTDKGLVKGYDFGFPATIHDGRLDAQYGTAGSPSSVHLDGRIHDDGAIEIRADGMTGASDYTVGRVVRGTRYGYSMTGRLDERRGEAVRRETRPCTAVLTRQ